MFSDFFIKHTGSSLNKVQHIFFYEKSSNNYFGKQNKVAGKNEIKHFLLSGKNKILVIDTVPSEFFCRVEKTELNTTTTTTRLFVHSV